MTRGVATWGMLPATPRAHAPCAGCGLGVEALRGNIQTSAQHRRCHRRKGDYSKLYDANQEVREPEGQFVQWVCQEEDKDRNNNHERYTDIDFHIATEIVVLHRQ